MRLPVPRVPSRETLLRRLETLTDRLRTPTPDPMPGQHTLPIPDPTGDDDA